MTDQPDIVTTLRRESFYRPTSRINSDGKVQMGFELMSINLQAADEIERLRKERDEARREVCELRTDIGFSRPIAIQIMEFAASRGWDCFKGEA